MLIASDHEERSVLRVKRVPILYRLKSETHSGGREYLFVHYMACTPAVYEVNKKLVRVCLRWSTKCEEDHTAVAGKKLFSRTVLTVGKWFLTEPLLQLVV